MPRRKATPESATAVIEPTATPTPTRPVRPLVTANPAELLERFKDYPAIDVISRRFNDPNDPGSLPILLKDEDPSCCTDSGHQSLLPDGATRCPIRALVADELNRPRRTGARCGRPVRKWYVRWVNTAEGGRWSQIKAKGYVPVEVRELRDEQDVADLVKQKTDGKVYVRRGDSGKEILCKMPLELFTYLKRQQRESQALRNNSKRAMADDLANAAGTELGDEAGQTIHSGGIKIESMRRSQSTLADEAESDAIDA